MCGTSDAARCSEGVNAKTFIPRVQSSSSNKRTTTSSCGFLRHERWRTNEQLEKGDARHSTPIDRHSRCALAKWSRSMIRIDGSKNLHARRARCSMIEYYPSRSRRFRKSCNFDEFIMEVLRTSDWKMVKIYELPYNCSWRVEKYTVAQKIKKCVTFSRSVAAITMYE